MREKHKIADEKLIKKIMENRVWRVEFQLNWISNEVGFMEFIFGGEVKESFFFHWIDSVSDRTFNYYLEAKDKGKSNKNK